MTKQRLSPTPSWFRLQVHVRTRASRSAILGYDGTELKVAIRAAAVENQANTKLVALLADQLNVGIRSVVILRGHGSRVKLMGLDVEKRAVEQWLAGLAESTGPKALTAASHSEY